jgi:transcriptional regulator with XRE-family HTH domain
MTSRFEGIDDDIWEQELAGEAAVQTVFALARSRFRELEREEQLTQQQLADKMGLKRSQISRWFGNPSNMTLRSAAKILMAMGRQLELTVSDPFALGRTGADGAISATQAPPAPSNVFQLQPRPAAGSPASLASPPDRLAAAPGGWSGGVKGETGMIEPEWHGEVETAGGTGRFGDVDDTVFLALDGDGAPARLRLGNQIFPLAPLEGAQGMFLVLPLMTQSGLSRLTRGPLVRALSLHEEAPLEYPIEWS